MCVGIARKVVVLSCVDGRINDLRQLKCELFPVWASARPLPATFRAGCRVQVCNLALAPVFWTGGREDRRPGTRIRDRQ